MLRAKNYQNQPLLPRVIQKIKVARFLRHAVHVHASQHTLWLRSRMARSDANCCFKSKF